MPRDELAQVKQRILTQFATADLDPGRAEEEISSLAERTIFIKKRVTDDAGFLKDRNEEPYVELLDFLGAGGQYLVFKGKMHFQKVMDFTRFWIPIIAHQLMEADGADLSKFLDYNKHLREGADKKGLKKVRAEVMEFIESRGYFPDGACAVKVSFEDISNIPRAKRETFTIGMHHPNIVFTLTEGKTAGNRVYRVMELVPKHVPPPEVRKKIGLRDQVEITMKVAEVLSFIEAKGAVHRDLKPENIMLAVKGGEIIPKVADFGLMKLREFQEVLTFLTASSCMLLGTPEYIAPEQAENPANADIRSDIYCLGATAYYWWTGHSPNPVQENASPRERVHLKFLNAINRERKPTNPLSLSVKHDFLSRIARKYQSVLAGMMATNPHKRYQKPADVVADLKRVLENKKPLGNPEMPSAVLSGAFSKARRRIGVARLAAASVALLALLLAAAYLACNFSPKLRNMLPAAATKALPWISGSDENADSGISDSIKKAMEKPGS